ncbi:hypothetical protein C7T35_10075 [Variovorax sp. WS11]|uniref:ABC-three component system protein n=1 Tax=Variovorax sp. WS11 TaxID=1105204 RepID=UPI000D0DCB93|nr:ABC-three component system protein [Variovorax sp. WS11]NDZ12697.1 hypothetical protein [Variovorax sp. WS11]PSL84642.1 hypothetical protein C7T35_10075 [Variovorax sp. WS11]
MSNKESGSHSAEGAALGFYFQSLYALRAVLEQPHDDAAVCLERLDDVEVVSNGEPLLAQLKHSIAAKPSAVTLASRALWRTFKAWIDVLPRLVLEETRFQLVTVAPLGAKDALAVLLDETADRGPLRALLVLEAQRVVQEHEAARVSSSLPLPHGDRIAGCTAFLQLGKPRQEALLARMTVRPGASNIAAISDDITAQLVNFPPDKRPAICVRLIEWWDLQVIFTLCGKRERFIGKIEVQQKIAELAGEIERDELLPDFETALQPDDHEPNSMIARQIELVGGTRSDVRVAVREEWRARAQRHKWCSARLDMAVRIDLYDKVLQEAWRDRHERMVEDCEGCDDANKRKSGHQLLRWSYEVAHTEVRPFANNWSASYYVRGTYQVLAIELQVGWHPQFKDLLGQTA